MSSTALAEAKRAAYRRSVNSSPGPKPAPPRRKRVNPIPLYDGVGGTQRRRAPHLA